jgi:putative colanic acid biosynthesis acetyltransferase WcaF
MMKKTDLSTFNNQWYKPGSLLRRILWFVVGRMFVHTYLPYPVAIKVAILRLFGAKIGKGVMIKPKVNIKFPWFLEIEDYAWIGENVWIDNFDTVKIGSNACVSQGAMLLTGNHNYKKSSFDLMIGKIILEEGVWIGAQCLVGPGVTCHSHGILSAGSVLTSDLPAYQVWRGNPAFFVRNREIV